MMRLSMLTHHMINMDMVKERVEEAVSGARGSRLEIWKTPLLFLFFIFIHHLSFILSHLNLFVILCCTFSLSYLYLNHLDYQ